AVAVLGRLIDRAHGHERVTRQLVEHDRRDRGMTGHRLEFFDVDDLLGRRLADLTRERDFTLRRALREAVVAARAKVSGSAHGAVLARAPPVLHVFRVREGFVDERARRIERARDLDLAHVADDVDHRAIESALCDEDLPAGTRLELGEGDAYHLRPPPFLQVLRLCEHIEDALARRVEDPFYDELLDRHFHDVIPCGHVASPSFAVPSGTRPDDRAAAPR